MSKCDFCIDRIRIGLNPVCVDSCPMRALDFGPLEELRIKYGSERDIFPLPASNITSPSIVIKKHKNSNNKSNPHISNREEVTDGS
jgi:Fe-S-cluster-containing dehydrogenase component